jgi:hypothetical protein
VVEHFKVQRMAASRGIESPGEKRKERKKI